MSITQGMTGGGSWSGVRTLRAFPTGPGYKSLGRGNLNLVGFATNRELAMAALSIPLIYALGTTLWPARAVKILGSPVFWGAHNLYQEAEDLRDMARGEDMSWQLDVRWRPIFGPHPMFGPVVIPLPFPYLDFTKSPSPGGGGPGEIPNLHRPPPSIEESGVFISEEAATGPSSAQVGKPGGPASSTKRGGRSRRKKCPKGYHWSKYLRMCIRDEPDLRLSTRRKY